ncbi:beta-N-acetylhexosaminidase [Halorhodospira halochloris]|uniref:Beta-hexosaminidase n=1 Tax=Halorhodospira halochloris TaxID=1052 RepID=A0A0X8X9H3_HALHR|nr:beta-N-acetylhexosaminidase [Halorhodospira halochloris]MCG5531369.1 beta-N-acetylhexosaminidase [Halorhodospira halochloris]BAU57967.1 beta N-acetyl-glucosaminidase [Halorhodospira halochloris]
MTLGPLQVAIDSQQLTETEREMLLSPAVGGVVLFARNFNNPQQLSELTHKIKSLRDPPLLITVDQEGGRVQRFKNGFTLLPEPARLGRIYFWEPGLAIQLATTLGWLMAAELRACSVDLSFAPVLDLDRGLSSVIGDRAFHSQPQAVIALAQAWIKGMRQAGMAAVGKHFPGHGAVEADSHVAMPYDGRSLSAIASSDLIPFQRLALESLPAIMAAHVIYPQVDETPAGFSSTWIGDVLRRRIGFRGAVFSDDLGMVGASGVGDIRARVDRALQAGCDAALVCDRQLAEQVLSTDPLPRHADGKLSSLRLARLYATDTGADLASLKASAQWQQASRALDAVPEVFYSQAC